MGSGSSGHGCLVEGETSQEDLIEEERLLWGGKVDKESGNGEGTGMDGWIKGLGKGGGSKVANLSPTQSLKEAALYS